MRTVRVLQGELDRVAATRACGGTTDTSEPLAPLERVNRRGRAATTGLPRAVSTPSSRMCREECPDSLGRWDLGVRAPSPRSGPLVGAALDYIRLHAAAAVTSVPGVHMGWTHHRPARPRAAAVECAPARCHLGSRQQSRAAVERYHVAGSDDLQRRDRVRDVTRIREAHRPGDGGDPVHLARELTKKAIVAPAENPVTYTRLRSMFSLIVNDLISELI